MSYLCLNTLKTFFANNNNKTTTFSYNYFTITIYSRPQKIEKAGTRRLMTSTGQVHGGAALDSDEDCGGRGRRRNDGSS